MNIYKLDRSSIDNIYDIYDITLTDEKPLEAVGLTLAEEVGELSEQSLILTGHISEPLKEPPEGEIADIADILNCAFSALFKAYPNLNLYQILSLLAKNMQNRKTYNRLEDGIDCLLSLYDQQKTMAK